MWCVCVRARARAPGAVKGGRLGLVRHGDRLPFRSLPSPASAAAAATAASGSWASASFPSGSSVCARGVVRAGASIPTRPGRWSWRVGSPGTLPPRRGSGLTVPERLVARGSVDPRVGSSALPRFLALRVRLAPVRVPSCRVPARRFKDPRGGRPSAPGVGEAVGPVGGSVRRAFPVPPRPAPSDSQGLSSLGTAAAPEACGPGTVILSRAPPGRPWGPVPCVRLARFPWAAAIAGAGSRVVLVPSFLSRSRPFSFLNHVSFRFSRWPARGESPSPIRPPSAEEGGRGGRLCRRQQTREFAHTRNFRYDS